MIADRHGVAPEQIALTTGSGEALSAIAMIYGPNGPIVAPRLFWDTTALYAARLGMATIDRVPLKADMSDRPRRYRGEGQ
jgi:histidinol-phosphate aminotransferase